MSMNARGAEARDRYLRMRRRAVREDWLARLTGKQNDLLPFEAVAGILKLYEHRQLTEHRFIPLEKIVGSVGRHQTFTRTFLPRSGVSFDRWSGIEAAMLTGTGVPPIEVYQIGDVYFVADGNHRVAVARANDFRDIDAYVTRVPGDPRLQPGDSLDEAIVKVECAHFLAQTRLAQECEELDIAFGKPGGYPKLLEHIYAHRYVRSIEHDPQSPGDLRMSFPEAARDWYNWVYLPIVAAIREDRLLSRFPGATAAELYVWVADHLSDMAGVSAVEVTPDSAVSLLAREGRSPIYRTIIHVITGLARMTTGPSDY